MEKQDLIIKGPAGDLQAVLQVPDDPDTSYVAIVCHPHPLQEGSMDNKVVTTVAKAFNAMGYPAVRFNFRGVGKSAGSFDNAVGEVADCEAVVAYVRKKWPLAELFLAGFSFGSYVAAETATKVDTQWLIMIGPPVERFPFDKLPPFQCPYLVIQGDADDVVVPQGVYDWFAKLPGDKELVKFEDTGHFFHGKLIELQQVIQEHQPS